MDVSIVIINYNTKQLTFDCINSIFEKTKTVKFEVILVDNGSSDGSKEFFEQDTRIKYIYSYENMGFGRANNVGMMLAKGDYIFLLNSDTILVNDAVGSFFEYAKQFQECAFLGCWLENQSGNYINSGGDIQTISSILRELCKSYLPGRHEGDNALHRCMEKHTRVGYVTGADLFFHRSIYEKTGGFDHMFFMYSEELDWQRTAAKQGMFSYIINGPRIIHLEGGSQNIEKKRFNLAKFKRFTKSRFYYIKKEYPKFLYIGFRILYFALYVPKLLFGASRGKNALNGIVVLLD